MSATFCSKITILSLILILFCTFKRIDSQQLITVKSTRNNSTNTTIDPHQHRKPTTKPVNNVSPTKKPTSAHSYPSRKPMYKYPTMGPVKKNPSAKPAYTYPSKKPVVKGPTLSPKCLSLKPSSKPSNYANLPTKFPSLVPSEAPNLSHNPAQIPSFSPSYHPTFPVGNSFTTTQYHLKVHRFQ